MSNTFFNKVHRVSKLFQPVNVLPKNAKIKHEVTAKSHRLMQDVGIIRQANTGMYSLLPLGLRALQKLINLVDEEMDKVDAQKMLLPLLTSEDLWKRSGRLDSVGPELFRVEDRHSKLYILSPTHEEAITDLISAVGPLLSRNLPLRLYQISSKWRDEMKPRLGLLRGREFLMKDLYTFDSDIDKAAETYEQICRAYDSVFKRIGIEYVKVLGDTGMIGGSLSHEYHFLSDIGEDNIVSCPSCSYSANTEVYSDPACPKCKENLSQSTGVEVGHTFLLGKKYSESLKATHLTNGKPEPLVMGCYGLGLTRILGAAIEILSTNDELRWPRQLAPYDICIISPKDGSKEAEATHYADEIYKILEQTSLDIILDDRTNLTIGKRMLEAKRTGYPHIVVIGRKAMEANPLFEVYDLHNATQTDLSIDALRSYFSGTDWRKETR